MSVSIEILNVLNIGFINKITSKITATLYLTLHSISVPGYTLLADLCIEMLKQLEEDQSTQHEDPTQTGGAVRCNATKFMENIAAQTFYGYKNLTVLCP